VMARALQIPLPIASRRSAATVDGFSLGITRAGVGAHPHDARLVPLGGGQAAARETRLSSTAQKRAKLQ
jgi:hypothetical protein